MAGAVLGLESGRLLIRREIEVEDFCHSEFGLLPDSTRGSFVTDQAVNGATAVEPFGGGLFGAA